MEKQCACFDDVKKVVSEYSQMLVKIAFTYLKSMHDAEDVVQDVFIIYMTKNPVFSGEEHRRNWLIRCTVNKCKDLLKAAWYKKWEPVSEELTAPMPEEDEVMHCIWQLEAKYRIPFHLHYYEGYSLNEIAKMLDKKPATVGTLLARARKKLERMMREDMAPQRQNGGKNEAYRTGI